MVPNYIVWLCLRVFEHVSLCVYTQRIMYMCEISSVYVCVYVYIHKYKTCIHTICGHCTLFG